MNGFNQSTELLVHQLKNLFLVTKDDEDILNELFQPAFDKSLYALLPWKSKYLMGQFNPYNSVMYCNFLYWLSHFLYLDNHYHLADMIYYLNKSLNSVDLFYAIDLPDIWSCEHPLGSVMGRASYKNGFFFYQGCTVGGDKGSIGLNNGKAVSPIRYPSIGENVTMYAHSMIIGHSTIGDNCIIAANTYIRNEKIPDNSLVFGRSPNLVIKERKASL